MRIIEDLASDWAGSTSGSSLSGEIEAVARQDADCERLMSVPGVGPIISSAMVATIGAGSVHKGTRPRRLARSRSQADIARRQHHPGQDIQCGNRYLRVLFVQAAWVVLIKPKSWERHWLYDVHRDEERLVAREQFRT